MVATDDDRYLRTLVQQEAGQLQNTFTWQDNLGVAIDVYFMRQCTQSQTVSVSGHYPQLLTTKLPQHAVEVVAHILLRHREACAINQALQLALLDSELVRTQAVLNARVFPGGEGRERKAAAAGFDHYLVAITGKFYVAALGQGLADIHELARGNSQNGNANRKYVIIIY